MTPPPFPRFQTLRSVRIALEAAETRIIQGDWLAASVYLQRAADLCRAEHEAILAHQRESK